VITRFAAASFKFHIARDTVRRYSSLSNNKSAQLNRNLNSWASCAPLRRAPLRCEETAFRNNGIGVSSFYG